MLRRDAEPQAPEGWLPCALGRFRGRHDPRVAAIEAGAGGASVLLIGLVFDIRDPQRSDRAYVAALADALAVSEAAFLAELAFAGGRHVVVCRRGGAGFLLTDATGMRAAFYADGRVIASHVDLVIDNLDRAAPKTRAFAWGYPGNRTPAEGVRLLTPNTALDLGSFRVRRYWPTAPLAEIPLEAAVAPFCTAFENAFAAVAARHDPLVSLTAGIDSRVTVAASRGRARYMTYYRNDEADSDLLDRRFAEWMVARFGIAHDLLDLNAHADIPEPYAEVLGRNTIRTHVASASYAYFRTYGDSSYVHLRSNLGEIGRQFFQFRMRALQRTALETADDLLALWLNRAPPAFARDAFAEFAEATDFFACAPCIDLTDLFYWEHRMGAWHAQVVASSDPAFETVSLYNCRHVLELMLSVPIEDRRRARLLKAMIRRTWPELAEFPLNRQPFDSYPFQPREAPKR